MKKNWRKELEMIVDISPKYQQEIFRLEEILISDDKPRIAVFGKYNHGKSTLLNALVGEEKFKVDDKRETVQVSCYEHDGIIWVDTPGLDVDVKGEDDHKAKEAALLKADKLCLIHSVRLGEFDRDELNLYSDFMKKFRNYNSKILIVLTQIDFIESEDLNRIKTLISESFPEITIISVSAKRYIKGSSENKEVLINLSNILELKNHLMGFSEEIRKHRRLEVMDILLGIRKDIDDSIFRNRKESLEAANEIIQERKELDHDVSEMRIILADTLERIK
ncbi:MAG: hypothetical protein COB58_00285 [Thalassobium sp.]|nr:MAG: hypothetical protein COB58_12350 [Thalassobium sp.]PHQ88295.1 MAG: hypothetical protein COB58_00285 [Thalassobium sp.]